MMRALMIACSLAVALAATPGCACRRVCCNALQRADDCESIAAAVTRAVHGDDIDLQEAVHALVKTPARGHTCLIRLMLSADSELAGTSLLLDTYVYHGHERLADLRAQSLRRYLLNTDVTWRQELVAEDLATYGDDGLRMAWTLFKDTRAARGRVALARTLMAAKLPQDLEALTCGEFATDNNSQIRALVAKRLTLGSLPCGGRERELKAVLVGDKDDFVRKQFQDSR